MSTLYVDNLQPNLGNEIEIPNLKPNAGSYVQLAHKETSYPVSLGNSGSFTTVLSHTITPRYATSRIKVSVCGVVYWNHTNTNGSAHFKILRNLNAAGGHYWSQTAYNSHYANYRTSALNHHIPVPFNWTLYDNPATTDATTYRLQFMPNVGTMNVYAGLGMYLEEIAQ